MPQDKTNRKVVLASRPKGAPTQDNFRLEEAPVPSPAEGQALLRTIYLSLDPYMRGRMNDGASYASPVGIGEVMVGGTINRVESSKHPGFREGDMVVGYTGWQEYALSDGSGLMKLPPGFAHPSSALGVLGMPGFTAYIGLFEIGKPKAGETVVVGAATGPVGAVVGQIAKIKGCRVVGIAGGAEKCRYAVNELGFDACLDHRSPDVAKQLAGACPKGIDIYFENIGGPIFDAVLKLLNPFARIPVCGLIAHYNDEKPREGMDRLPLLMSLILVRRLKVQGFIVTDHNALFGEFFKNVGAWVAEGKIKVREDIVDGLENAPKTFIGLLQGKNFGKQIIRVSQES